MRSTSALEIAGVGGCAIVLGALAKNANKAAQQVSKRRRTIATSLGLKGRLSSNTVVDEGATLRIAVERVKKILRSFRDLCERRYVDDDFYLSDLRRQTPERIGNIGEGAAPVDYRRQIASLEELICGRKVLLGFKPMTRMCLPDTREINEHRGLYPVKPTDDDHEKAKGEQENPQAIGPAIFGKKLKPGKRLSIGHGALRCGARIDSAIKPIVLVQ